MSGQLLKRPIDTISTSFAARSLETCIQNHKECNALLTGEPKPPYIPPRLYDIRNQCLRSDNELFNPEYAALSYVWGRPRTVILNNNRTLKENLGRRAAARSLSPDTMPMAYKSAIQVATDLNIGYIWIDSLCIVQNDAADQENNFGNHMANIYQNAKVTICCIADNADGSCFMDREVAQGPLLVPIINNSVIVAPRLGSPATDIGAENVSGPLWSTRGWTFQERVLSPRCLYFTKHQVYFECRREIVEECGTRNMTSVYKRLPYYADNQLPYNPEDIRMQLQKNWQSMIRDYSARDLSFASDKIPAITGIAKQIQGQSKDPAIKFGFFQDRLVVDILWEASGKSLVPIAPPLGRDLPTWSWAFWDGKVDWETYLAKAKPRADLKAFTDGTLQASKARLINIQAGAPVQFNKAQSADWLVYTVNHLVHHMLLDPPASSIGWAAYDSNPHSSGADIDAKKLQCMLVSETIDETDDKGKNGEKKRAFNVLLVSLVGNNPHGNTYIRRGVGQVLDTKAFDQSAETTIYIT